MLGSNLKNDIKIPVPIPDESDNPQSNQRSYEEICIKNTQLRQENDCLKDKLQHAKKKIKKLKKKVEMVKPLLAEAGKAIVKAIPKILTTIAEVVCVTLLGKYGLRKLRRA